MRSTHVALVLLLTILVSAAAAQGGTPSCGRPCREHPRLSGPCFTIHGRMNFYNGTPSVRIWRVGTKRILGVSEQRFALAGYCNLPTAIHERLSWDSDLFADFVVCPFTPEEPSVMQLVCVDSATHIVVRPSAPR